MVYIVYIIYIAPVYIPISDVQEFPFLHILTNTCYLRLFDDSHSDRCEVISHLCGFGLLLPDD